MAATLQEVRLRGVYTNGYLFRNLQALTFLYCIEDIGISTLSQVLPNLAIGLKWLLVCFFGGIHQVWQDSIATYIFCDILLGIVGAHLGPVIDILLKDIA